MSSDTPKAKGGAVDLGACQSRTWGACRCDPLCGKCGFRKHMAVHGPFLGEAPGSKPYGHEYRPAPYRGPLRVACPYCRAEVGTGCTGQLYRPTPFHQRRRDLAEQEAPR